MKNVLSSGIVLVAAIFIGCGGSHQQEMSQNTITTTETATLLQSNTKILLLDVRTDLEFKSETGHLKEAVLIPIQELEKRLSELEQFKDKTIVAYCRTGNRSGRAERILSQHGFHAFNMLGGITQWNKEQLPVVKETQ